MGRKAMGLMVAVLVSLVSMASAFNITLMLNAHPSYSMLNQLLTSSGVADEINSRTSLTVLAPSNAILQTFVASIPNADAGEVADLLRYHVLLQYLDMEELEAITDGNPSTVTSLLQTTGRTAGNEGSINIYNDGEEISLGLPDPEAAPFAIIVTNVTQTPYNISILQVDKVLKPPGFGVAAANGANITAVLEAGQTFTTFMSLIKSTGVDVIFATKQTGTGITIFAPNDAAFAALPAGALAALTPEQAKQTLQYHALTSYYPLGTLSTLNNPLAPTLATTKGGAGTFILNVTIVKGLVTLDSGVSAGKVSATLFDTNPTAVFAIDKVLLPVEIFAAAAAAPSPASDAPTPAVTAPVEAPSAVPVVAPAPLAPSAVPELAPVAAPVPAPSTTPSTSPAPAPGTPTPAPGPSPFASPPAPPMEEEPFIDSPSSAPAPGPEPDSASGVVVSRVILAAMVVVCGFALV